MVKDNPSGKQPQFRLTAAFKVDRSPQGWPQPSRLTARVNPTISDHPSSARTMRSITTCIVGLTLAVNLGRAVGSGFVAAMGYKYSFLCTYDTI